MDVSVIIPCFNEETTIGAVILAAKNELKKVGLCYEVIVVDNRSTDSSRDVASLAGATVVSSDAQTVAAVRNFGVSHSNGKVLVFLDGDVIVQSGWGRAFIHSWRDGGKKVIGGSHCLAPSDVPWVLSTWYSGIETDNRKTHLGTGHLIVSKDIFQEIGGFDTSLVSGEDYEFCGRARAKGISIVPDQRLRAVHEGYPHTLKAFFNREVWHGMGDCRSIEDFFKSKIAMLGVMVTLLLFISIVLAFLSVQLSALTLTVVVLLAFSMVIYKFGVTRFAIPQVLVAIIYLSARGWSLVVRTREAIKQKFRPTS